MRLLGEMAIVLSDLLLARHLEWWSQLGRSPLMMGYLWTFSKCVDVENIQMFIAGGDV